MAFGIATGDIQIVLEGLAFLFYLGLIVTILSYPVLQLSNRILSLVGWEPVDLHVFKQIFDQIMAYLMHPLERRTAFDLPPKSRIILLHLGLGLVVVVASIIFHLVSMATIAGVALAGYHFAGITFDPESYFLFIVSFTVFVAIAIMSYSPLYIRERVRYV